MTTDTTKYSGDGFSWRRVGELYAYYWPVIGKQVYIYLAVSLASVVAILLPYNDTIKTLLFSLSGAALGYAFTLAACIFTRHGDTRIVERLIPASGAEKLVFYLSYLLVVVAAVTVFPYYLAVFIYHSDKDSIMYGMAEVTRNTPFLLVLYNILANVAAALLCLFVILKARTNRVLKAVFSVLGFQMVIGFAFGVFSASLAAKDIASTDTSLPINATPQEAFEIGFHNSVEQSESIIDSILENSGIIIGMDVVLAIVLALIIWGIYRQLCKKNI